MRRKSTASLKKPAPRSRPRTATLSTCPRCQRRTVTTDELRKHGETPIVPSCTSVAVVLAGDPQEYALLDPSCS